MAGRKLPTVNRKESLRRMTELKLMVTGKLYFCPDTLASLLQHCPELTSLDMPMYYDDRETYGSFLDNVVQSCPKLKHLGRNDPAPDHGCMMFNFLDFMKENTLESFYFLEYTEGPESVCWTFDRHKESVKSIILDECNTIGINFLMALIGFPALEVFSISLNPWTASQFQELKLPLTLDKAQEALGKDNIDFSGPIPYWMTKLEKFYRQNGALSNLRILELRVTVEMNVRDSNRRRIIYSDKTLVGMLTLEDRVTGRPGWSLLLQGLRNLEELHGSFNLDAMAPGFEFGQGEADWIVEHWHKLKFVELYTQLEEAPVIFPPPVQSMVQRLPGLWVVGKYKNPHWD
ncbi:hypothetical protein BGZ96_004827 [Linnemannia gamsii]|uniref:Uncharacterized protein n=1 Tax=Linnemannia gamsii TaxID=64522 RepID=A0ABQ7JHS6_9FUNG|nr:hypothetical protein BGZ96_004827 [Linnemannia gamsii]